MIDPSIRFIDCENRYEVVRELGRGGMATVFEVIDRREENQARIALKLASLDPEIRESSCAHLESEFDLIRRIKSSHVVKAYERGVSTTGAPFFTMELSSGEPLSQLMATRREGVWFSIPEIVDILRQISEGVHAVHEAGLVYADLKPSNIIVNPTGRKYDVRLIDFGITCSSVPFTSDPELSVSTSSGLTGTSLYLSPEQARGFPLTIRSDIYSFGIVAYRLCTGELPFGGEGIFSVTASHLLGKVPPIRPSNPTVPKPLERTILVALEKLPGDRYSSMLEISKRLSSLLVRKSKSSQFLELIGFEAR